MSEEGCAKKEAGRRIRSCAALPRNAGAQSQEQCGRRPNPETRGPACRKQLRSDNAGRLEHQWSLAAFSAEHPAMPATESRLARRLPAGRDGRIQIAE